MSPPLRRPSPVLRRSIFCRFIDFVCCQKKKRIRQYVDSLYLEDKTSCDRTSNCDFESKFDRNATSTNLGIHLNVTANHGVNSNLTANLDIDSDVNSYATLNHGVNSDVTANREVISDISQSHLSDVRPLAPALKSFY